jgi:hypothetical protein
MTDRQPEHGVEGAEDFFVGDSGTDFAYSALSEIESLYEQLSESFEEIQHREPARGNIVVLTPEERAELLEFYTVVHAHIERISACILYEAIADKENRKPEPTLEFFREELSQMKREELLFRAGLIDSGLKGEMAKVKSVRNQLVHEQHKRMYVNLDNKTDSDIDRAYHTVAELDERLDELAGNNSSE